MDGRTWRVRNVFYLYICRHAKTYTRYSRCGKRRKRAPLQENGDRFLAYNYADKQRTELYPIPEILRWKKKLLTNLHVCLIIILHRHTQCRILQMHCRNTAVVTMLRRRRGRDIVRLRIIIMCHLHSLITPTPLLLLQDGRIQINVMRHFL